MAFCIRSERKMGFQNKIKSFPGPGQYDGMTKKNKLNKKMNYPPFHSSAQRNLLINNSDTPGPGSYNLNKSYSPETSTYQNKIGNNSIEKNNNNSIKSNIIYQNSSLTNTSKINNISLKKKFKNKSFSSNDLNSKHSDEKFHNFCINLNIGFLSPIHCNEKLGFLSQTKRFDKSELDKENFPGPGSYNESINSTINESKLKPKLKNASLVEKTGSLKRVISIPSKKMNGYIYGNTNNHKNTSYIFDSDNNNSSKALSLSLKNNIINSIKNNSKTKILNEKASFCNDLDLFINQISFLNSDMNNSDTNEIIGPGSYDAKLKSKNNNIINWSKSFNLKKINQKKELQKRIKLIEEMRKVGEYNAYKLNLNKMKNIKPLKSNRFHKDFKLIKRNNLQNKILDSFRNSFIPNKSDIPGPGYYNKEIIKRENNVLYKDKIEINEKNNSNINNKNSIDETIKIDKYIDSPFNKSKSSEDLGPTTYFKEKNKYEPEKKNTIYKNIILGKTQMSCSVINNSDFYSPEIIDNKKSNEIKKQNESQNNSRNNKTNKKTSTYSPLNSNSKTERNSSSIQNHRKNPYNKPLIELLKMNSLDGNPGPGAYELSQTFIKPSFSSTSIMENKGERFIYKINENPGPGSYQNININSFDLDKQIIKKNNELNYEYFQEDYYKERRIKNIIEFNKRGNEVPGTGSYNIDERNSILYKICSRFNPSQSYYSPFMNSSGRFEKKKKGNVSLSPTLYDPYEFENIPKNKKYILFNKAIRFNRILENKRKNEWFFAGPGSYNLTPIWNKKSFNILFSETN